MDCSDVTVKFVDYIDGDLSEEGRLCVELHVAQCYACREELDELGRMLELCGAALEHPCPTDRLAELKERLASAEPQYNLVAPRRKLRVREVVFKLAVAALIIALIGISPLLVQGAKRLFTAREQPGVLGNGADLKQLRLPFNLHLIAEQRKLEKQIAEGESAEQDKADYSTSEQRR